MLSMIKSERGRDMEIDELQYVYSRNGINRDKSVLYWESVEGATISVLLDFILKLN